VECATPFSVSESAECSMQCTCGLAACPARCVRFYSWVCHSVTWHDPGCVIVSLGMILGVCYSTHPSPLCLSGTRARGPAKTRAPPAKQRPPRIWPHDRHNCDTNSIQNTVRWASPSTTNQQQAQNGATADAATPCAAGPTTGGVDRQTDRQTGRQAGRQAGRHRNVHVPTAAP
jgi:hypothetical protein